MIKRNRLPPQLLLFTGTVGLVVALLGINGWSSNPRLRVSDKKVFVLQTSEALPEAFRSGHVGSIRASSRDDQTLLLVNGATGDAKQYKEGLDATVADFNGVVITNPDGLGVYQDGDSTVVVLDPANKQVARFPTYPIVSLAVLRSGNVLVASPAGNHFLHLYTSSGRLLKSFGTIKNYSLPTVDVGQKQFFHKGKILVDVNDNIYYAFFYIPVIQKYSSTGRLQFERQVKGKAIDLQQELADRFLRSKAPGSTGGIGILNSAAIDPKTAHLWVCMNGSSDVGIVYEYGEEGEKLSEYMLRTNLPGSPKRRLAGVYDIAITRSNLYALGAYREVLVFKIRDDSARGSTADQDTVRAETACGTGQTWQGCTFTCPGLACNNGQPTATSSDGTTVDCRAALLSALQPGYVLISSNCQTFQAGTSSPAPHLRGACRDDVVVCYTGTGQSIQAIATIDCAAPPSDACSGGDELCIAYWQGESYCGQPAKQWGWADRSSRLSLYIAPALARCEPQRQSETTELHSLPSLGITALDLDYRVSKRIDQFGNGFRYRAKVYDARGAHVGQWARDVILVKQ